MMLVDANLLLYAKVADYPQHTRARPWLEARLSGPNRVGLPWPSLLAFLRLITNPRLFDTPLRMEQAWGQVQEWLGLPTVWVPGPTERHAEILGRLLQSTNVVANLVSDAHLAALAMEHGLVLYSSDSDFARFPGLAGKTREKRLQRGNLGRYKSATSQTGGRCVALSITRMNNAQLLFLRMTVGQKSYVFSCYGISGPTGENASNISLFM